MTVIDVAAENRRDHEMDLASEPPTHFEENGEPTVLDTPPPDLRYHFLF